ncbi:MAG TPA: OmpA family protein [Paraburkholderia sp.]|jgi:outer membrane protein OmpA-like peptidoglycan-associated protein
MKHRVMLAAAVAAALAGCAGQAARDQLNIQDPSVARGGFGSTQDASAGAAVKQWTDVYTQIKHRGDVLDALQDKLNRLGARKDTYYGAKAQCWIDAGKQEFAAHDEWGFVEESIGEAASLIAGVESGNAPATDNRPLRTTTKVRADLWDQLAVIRTDGRFASCPQAQKLAACAEVELMHAGHEAWTHAFAKAQQRTDVLQRQVRDASGALSACAAVAPPASLPEVISLSADALFEFDRGDIAAIGAEGRRRLDDIAVALRAMQSVERLVVSGYTDRLGSTEYNRRLSRQRAETIRRYLIGRDVTVPIDAHGYGNAQPGTVCSMHSREMLIDCLSPDRRVDIRVVGTKLKGSAPLNSPRPPNRSKS